MLLPAALRPRPCALAAVALACVSSAARAQYKGGNGDGYSSVELANVYIDGVHAAVPAYFASTAGGDGYSVAGRVSVTLNGSTLPAALYVSSTAGGDGYSVSSNVLSQPLNGVSSPAALFLSSSAGGDGYDVEGFSSQRLDGSEALAVAYTGSTAGGDGYDVEGAVDLPLDVNLAYHFIFSGGNGDGYDTRGVILTTLNGTSAEPAPYLSSTGGGDGYDADGLVNLRLDGFVFPDEVYVSSTAGGDGYDVSGASFVALDGSAPLLVTYLGGPNGDGYDDEHLRNVLLDPSLAPPAFVYTGGFGDGYDVEGAPYVFYFGAGGAAAPMTYSIWRGIQFPAEEIAAGLAADNADPDRDGLPNLVEYTTGGDPHLPDSGVFGPQFRLSDLSDFGRAALPDKHLTAIVHRDPRIFDATLSVEFSSETTSLWNAADAVPVDATSSLFIVRDRVGRLEAPHRLLRLRATVNP